MKILEFGNINKRKIILIHGFQSPWQVWNKYIEHYKNDYHIIIPIMSGHNPESKEDFISFSNEAREIEDYIISRYGKNVYAVFGMSMGGILTAVLWQNKKLSFEKVIFDGSPLISINKFMKKFMIRFYTNVTHKSKQRDKKTIEQAVKVIISEDNLECFLDVLDNMSDITIKNCITEVSDFKLKNNVNSSSTTIYYFHGTAPNEMLAKKSAKYIKKHYESAKIKCFDEKFHCENSLFYQDIMIAELNQIL